MRDRPTVPDIERPAAGGVEEDVLAPPKSGDGRPTVGRHRGMKVQSVIDVHSWDEARWKGILYASYGDDVPPIFALTFVNAAGARRIFERWRERFGTKDVNHDINMSIIRNLSGHPASHYAIQITSRRPDNGSWERGVLYQTVNRVHVMEPADNTNLVTFLSKRRSAGCFMLAPAVLSAGQPDILTDLVILKRDIKVVDAADVAEHDIENVALEMIARRRDG